MKLTTNSRFNEKKKINFSLVLKYRNNFMYALFLKGF